MHPAPSKKVYWLVIFSWLVAGGFLLLVRQASAQAVGQEGLDVGLTAFLPLTGLGAPDVRIVIASIIKAILGLIGVIFLGLILYGGFVWMTAGGNAEKVTQAKKILTNGVIGLVIVLSAYSITSFVILQLGRATGVRVGEGTPFGAGGGVGGLPRDAFVVRGISPQGKVSIRNVVVRITFSRNIDQATVPGNITVRKSADLSNVDGAFNVTEKTVEFTPSAACPAPNNTRKCFDANTEFVVDVRTGLRSLDGKELICGLGGSSCRAVFITGDLVDVAPPQVSITTPIEGQAISADSIHLIEATATDDAGISQIIYLVDESVVDIDSPTSDVSPTTYKSTGNWDTTGINPGSTHVLKARALDIDTNEATSAAVNVLVRPAHCFNKLQDEDETAIDCGGKACGACTGQACTKNSDCAAGVCLAGRCLELPLITNVDPLNGAPGNFITLQGVDFGTAPGQVKFLGDINNPADDQIASLASCQQAWQESQVIVEVPANAKTGPIRLNTAAGLFDQTNDPRGFRGDFTVNNIVRPGLCSVSPTFGESGTTVSLQGKSFGSEKDTVVFSGTRASQIATWSAEQITGVVVPTVNPGKAAVVVAVKNERSNSFEFEVRRSLIAPIIDSINPVSGPVGQYVTIKGSNFGATAGSVKFLNVASGVETLADVSFPAICQRDYWHDDYIIVKVPDVAVGSYKVKVVKENRESNSVDFTVNRTALTPGVCKVDPDNGPTNITVNLYGERFGSAQGKVRFFDRQENGRISLWTDTNVKVDVPPLARTGPLQQIDSAGSLSNAVIFTVGVCSANSCSAGEECCGNGSCQTAGSCVSVRPACTYQWLFSTGDLIDPSLIPSVVDDNSCRDGNPQSPAPYRDTTDACVNAQVSARFNKNMRDSTLNLQNIFITGCNTGGDLDPRSCTRALPGTLQIIGRGTDTEAVLLKPNANFAANTWHQVTIKSAVQSDLGINMLEDYVWHFKTREEATLCSVDFVEVVPEDALIQEFNGQQEFSGLPTAANCNLLNPDAYRWSWISSDPSRARVEPDIDSNTIATALAETESGQPVRVAGAIPSENRGDFGELVIDFGDPRVVEHFPACTTACGNAKIGARFNIPMKAETFTEQTVKLFSCQEEQCTNLTPEPITNIVYDPVRLEVEFTPLGGLLRPAKFYRALVLGGAAGVKSTSNTNLVGLNFSSTVGPLDSYSWIFKTRDQGELCAVDRVEVAPLRADLFLIGATQDYSSQAFSSPDLCDSRGQRLNSFTYDWAWLSTDPDVATISNQDALPQALPDGRIDPNQFATAVSEGTTKIQASTQRKLSEGELRVVCGFQRDGQCPPPATLETYGVGQDTCCRPRPAVIETNPANGAADICRNALIAVSFNQFIDEQSLADNFILEGNFGERPCPEFEDVTGTIEQIVNADGSITRTNWCSWPGQLSLFHIQDHTRVHFTIKRFMEANRQYRVRLRGDNDLRDLEKVGVQNIDKIAMNGDYIFKFNVGEEICKVEAVDIIVAPPGETVARDLFLCAGRDDCENDQNDAVNGNQHAYFALARDRKGNLLPANFNWTKSGLDNVDLVSSNDQLVYVTGKPIQGESDINVVATAIEPTIGSASRSQRIEVFLCENPWPPISSYPYVDPTTNFSLLFCRDAGEKGFVDDLPGLAPAITKPGQGNVIKEFLFVVD